jgi:drug/metabolite transporter (DMT)-like permease
MLAITTALCCTLFFSARDVILRYYKVNKKYPAFELSLDSLFLYSLGCTLFALYMFGFKDYEFDWGSFSAGCMSAVLNTLGFMMLGISIVIGYAGPANALNSVQAIVLTFLGVMMMNQIPSHMQVTGMLLGMAGTIIVSVGDAIVKVITDGYQGIKGKKGMGGEYEKLND